MAVSVSAGTTCAPPAVPRGAFIVLEGVDRCGKTTQAARLTEALGAEFMRFPDRTTAIGVMINSYLAQGVDMDDRAVHLLFSANRWEAKARIESTLASGKHIVCDRYAFSGVAFSGAKDGLDVEWCAAPDRGLPAPDLVVYLDLAIEAAMERGAFGEERYEKEGFQRKVQTNFRALMAREAGESGATPWHVVDAAQSMDAVTAEIHSRALEAVEAAKHEPLRKLWVKAGDV